MTLMELRPDTKGRVTGINCKESTKRRLMDIGLTKGVDVHMKGSAPLGDPLLIDLRGFMLAIRKSDAKDITISAEEIEALKR